MNFDNNVNDVSGMNFGGSECSMQPIYEPMSERVCHRYMCYEVPHIVPINTRIINHHIYKHTYRPCYTCCEENEVCNVNVGCNNKFM